jgi:ferredoxin-nitrite reductase
MTQNNNGATKTSGNGLELVAGISQQEFTEEQKSYLQGFVSGCDVARTSKGLPPLASTLAGLGLPSGSSNGTSSQPPENAQSANGHNAVPSGPDAIYYLAQNRFLDEGKQLTAEEQAKRRKHPLDMWDELQQHVDEGRFPKGTDVFCFKYRGLFYVAPAQDSFMCRLRFPGGILNSYQLRQVATIAETLAGGYADVTTRANLQLREIGPKDTLAVLNALQDCGIINRGAGADNIRNITGSSTAGIDPQELIDTRPLSHQLHHYILNHREMYGLPRKFNIAFDGGGQVSVLEDTNDIGFVAVRVSPGNTVPAGVYFRMQLGGITGHKDFAQDTGVLLKPEECVPMAAAVVRVFIDHGDRTDRKKARLKYLLDCWGIEKLMEHTREHLSFEPMRFPLEACELRAPALRHGHIGFHRQSQPGLCYVGVVLPVGRLRVEQLRGLAEIADCHGSGTIRLTVWQNLLISDIPEDDVPAVKTKLEQLGLGWSASQLRGSLVACTGNAGCKFAATNTKRHALEIADHLESRIEIDQPLNLHLTGCPHSCAQHYIGDIGFLGTKVDAGDDMVEGYHIYVGGGYGEHQEIGREIYRDVTAEDAPAVTQNMLSAYLRHRLDANESFSAFTKRHSTEQLKELFAEQITVAD